MKRSVFAACASAWLMARANAVPLPSCLPARPIQMVVRIGTDSPPTLAQLRGGALPKISLEERETGRVLWTAADIEPARQQFPAMQAAFSGSFAAVDLDGDGVHDRLYAGDLAGRLWRFDLHHGATAEHWASGGIWADFSAAAGRGFVAPPDVSLPARPGDKPWLNIAIGTARTTDNVVANRFYVLRDHNPFDTWSDEDYRRWRPLREADLLALGNFGDESSAAIDKGYYFELGTADVIAPSLTVSGRAALALSTSASNAACEVTVSVASFDINTALSPPSQNTDAQNTDTKGGSTIHSSAASVATGFVLASDESGRAVCTLAGEHVAACDVDTKPVALYWRREDAD
jgi:hypothetical protein